MTQLECIEAIRLHAQTHRIVQNTAALRGDHVACKRAQEVAAAAEQGKLLPWQAGDAHTPDLHLAAAEYGLIAQ